MMAEPDVPPYRRGTVRIRRFHQGRPRPVRAVVATWAAALLLAACTGTGPGAAGTASPTASPGGASASASAPTPSASASTGAGVGDGTAVGTVDTPEAAIDRVVAQEPRLAGIAPQDPGLVGQASWYVVEPSAGGSWLVKVRVGWGDCEAGCINVHSWVHSVAGDGTVTLVSEAGPAVPTDAWPASHAATGPGIAGLVTAGPTCPVARATPDPACADRFVAGAVLQVTDAPGTQVARIVSAQNGTFFQTLPPGSYTVTPQPVAGLMGTPAAQAVVVTGSVPSEAMFRYDTGIR